MDCENTPYDVLIKQDIYLYLILDYDIEHTKMLMLIKKLLKKDKLNTSKRQFFTILIHDLLVGTFSRAGKQVIWFHSKVIQNKVTC